MKKLLAVFALLVATQSAWAIDLDTAKARGLVGEDNTGFLAAVKSPPSAEVRALITEVNAKRQSSFERTAEKTGATVEQVAVRFYQLALERTAPGHYFQDASGRWQTR